ncbi:MAG: sugar phosphate isomerase/epimerase [Bacteroidetes bacterium]|nr:sugar phosphate isomerase/epimerase [Bacteroidota bacterium]
MYLAIHNWMKPEPLELTVQRLANYGYSALEIQGEPYKYDTSQVKTLLDHYDVRCWGSVTLMLENRNLLAKDETQRAQSVTYVKDCIKMVSSLGGSVISVVPSTVGKLVPDSTPELEWKWCVEALQDINAYARKCNVKIGIEPINRFETYFINRGAQALALAEAVGPDCGVCLDIFHMNIEENEPIAAIHEAGDRLVNFHVADNNRMACGMGSLDWPTIIQTLREIDYNGALSVEFCPPLDRTPANRFTNSVDPNPDGISESERKFLEDHGSSVFSTEFYDHHVRRSAETLLPLIA